MDIKITSVDENEARVVFSGLILISAETQGDFKKELQEVIDKYAI